MNEISFQTTLLYFSLLHSNWFQVVEIVYKKLKNLLTPTQAKKQGRSFHSDI